MPRYRLRRAFERGSIVVLDTANPGGITAPLLGANAARNTTSIRYPKCNINRDNSLIEDASLEETTTMTTTRAICGTFYGFVYK